MDHSFLFIILSHANGTTHKQTNKKKPKFDEEEVEDKMALTQKFFSLFSPGADHLCESNLR